MELLVEKYRPATIAEFSGLASVMQDASDLVANPYSCALLFVGKSGTGKTTLAQAIANELQAETIHIPSQSCTVETVKTLRSKLAYAPLFGGGWRVVIVDEADEMSASAENAWLSILDSTDRPESTIFIFTCNETEKLKARFTSRCEVVNFSTEGLAPHATKLLAEVWKHETNNAQPAPNFALIVKDSKTNIRESLQVLQKHVRRAKRA
jgi:DNA polymerase III gamma/tau subunit